MSVITEAEAAVLAVESTLRSKNRRKTARRDPSKRPLRPAWIEIHLGRLRRNFELINRDKPETLQLLSVVKDEAYGHGSLAVAQVALEHEAVFLGLATLEEALALREKGIRSEERR